VRGCLPVLRLDNGLSIGPVQLVEPVCPDCGVLGVYHYDYGKTCCPTCGKDLRGGGVLARR